MLTHVTQQPTAAASSRVTEAICYVGGLFLLLLIVCIFLSADPTYAFGDRHLLCTFAHHSITDGCDGVSPMKRLNGASELGLKLGKRGKDMGVAVYADASYAVHADCKSHGDTVAYSNRGPACVKCAKRKMASKSSAEAELTTLSDAASLAAYNISFLRGQGYDACADLKRDNASTIKLAENVRSDSDRAKRIQARRFFVKQRLDQKAMKATHCPTREMIADALAKPIQGEQLRALRDMLRLKTTLKSIFI